MAAYTYQSHKQQTTPGTAFAEGRGANGHYWLVGASGKQIEVLLNRLSDVLSKPTAPTAEQIEQTVDEYWSWFRDAYQQSKGDECTYTDDQITEGAGLAWINAQGHATLFSLGNFRFCTIANDQLTPLRQGYLKLQLLPNSLLIADPSRADIALPVVGDYRKGGNRWEAITEKTYNYPVAVVQALQGQDIDESDDEGKYVKKQPRAGLLVLIATIAGLLAGGSYYILPMLPMSKKQQTTEAVTDSATTISPRAVEPPKTDDSPQANKSTQPAEAKTLPKDTSSTQIVQVEPKKTTEPTELKPVLASTTSEITKKPERKKIEPSEPQPQSDPADDYLTAGRRAFAKAEKLRATGSPNQAIQQYEAALASFTRFGELRPADKAIVARPIATCRASLTTLKETPSF